MSCIMKRYILDNESSFFIHIKKIGGFASVPDLVGNHDHDEFVSRGGEKKRHEHGARARELVRADGRRVDVSQQEVVHGLVPLAGELFPGGRVPL